jgi:chromosome segregation ATPase
MTTATATVEAPVFASVITETSDVIAQAKTASNLQEQIEKVSTKKLKDLLERSSKLHSEIDQLSSIDAESKMIAVKSAELQSVNAEIAKRTEDIASLSYMIAEEMETFGQMSVDALKDTDVDIAKRNKSLDAVKSAEKQIVDARTEVSVGDANIITLEAAKVTAEKSFIWGRTDRVQTAQRALESAQYKVQRAREQIEAAEKALEDAKTNIPVVEEEIRLDKRVRLKDASLLEVYRTISTFVTKAKNILKVDIGEYQTRIKETETSRIKAIERGEVASKRIHDAKQKIEELEVQLAAKQLEIDDLTDRTDPAYQALATAIDDITIQLDAQNNEQKLAESAFSDAEIAKKERKMSIMTLTAQLELAKHQFNQFVMNEETAYDVGQNIEVIVKGNNRAIIHESLGKGINKMTLAVYDVSRKAAIASAAQISNLQEEKVKVLKTIDSMDEAANAALALQFERFEVSTQKLREVFKAKGVDIDGMQNLKAAADLAKQMSGTPAQKGDAEQMF